MSETLNLLSERRRAAESARDEAERRLEELANEHATLSLDAFEGDVEAERRIAQIDAEIAEEERGKRLAAQALVEIGQLEQQAEARAAEEERQHLTAEFDHLVIERKKALSCFEKALDTLESAVEGVLEVDDKQREVGRELGLFDGSLASCVTSLRNRFLTRLGSFVQIGPTTLQPEPLTEDTGALTQSIAEATALREEEMRQREERQAEEWRIRAILERRQKIMRRRDELLAQAGHATSPPWRRAEIEDQVERLLAEEFPPEEPETKDRRAS